MGLGTTSPRDQRVRRGSRRDPARDERITEGRLFYGHAYWRVDTVKDAMSKLPGFRERAFDATIGIAPSYEGDGRTAGLTPRRSATRSRRACAAARVSRRRAGRGPLPGRVRGRGGRMACARLASARRRRARRGCARRSRSTGARTAGRCGSRSCPSRRRTTCAAGLAPPDAA